MYGFYYLFLLILIIVYCIFITFQLRVIRAFKSTLEDMEEKRSCHSMHSLRSTRSHLARPTSDISYIDDEERGRKGSGQATNGHYIRASAHGMSQTYAKPLVVEASSSSNYLKVDGGAYRVQRSISSGSGTLAQAGTTQTRQRASSDAATQSVESCFTQTDESCLAPNPVFGVNMHMPPVAPPSPVPPVLIEGGGEGGRGSIFGYTRATSPTPPTQFGHIVPSPYYHPPYYEPAYYHTYLNPMVASGLPDGYQYEVVVRRPSVGPTELTVPVPNPDPNRRPSMGHFPSVGQPVFPHHHPHPSPHSLPGSFDSAQGPPTTPMYNHVTQQPLSPRHFPSGGGGGVTPVPPPAQAHHNASSPLAVVVPDQKADPRLTGHPPPESKPIQIPASEIPKLIHETSI